jgi:hypothetical protein
LPEAVCRIKGKETPGCEIKDNKEVRDVTLLVRSMLKQRGSCKFNECYDRGLSNKKPQ